jgi:hypothetical protein
MISIHDATVCYTVFFLSRLSYSLSFDTICMGSGVVWDKRNILSPGNEKFPATDFKFHIFKYISFTSMQYPMQQQYTLIVIIYNKQHILVVAKQHNLPFSFKI